MILGPPRILTCPHCRADKQVLSIISGNTLGLTVWSDNKKIAPMMPQPSFVQKCPKCEGYFLLSRQTGERYAEGDQSGGKGELTYAQLKEAYASLKNENLSETEHRAVLLSILWAFNDTYTRVDKIDIPKKEQSYIREIVFQLLNFIVDPLFRAELCREIGDWKRAKEELSKTTRTEDWYLEIKDSIEVRVASMDTKVFVLVKGR